MQSSNELINFYNLVDKKYKKKYHNPQYNKTHIFNIPFRMIIAGSSGSQKTLTLLNIIHRMSDTFEKVIICIKTINEPLYLHLINQLDADFVEVYESDPKTGIVNIPKVDNYKNTNKQILIVFDDLMLEDKKVQQKIAEYYIRGRKIAGGISCVYISQSYYRIPKTIRINCNYLILKTLSSTRDLNMVLTDTSLSLTKRDLNTIYKDAIKDNGFLLIDLDYNKFYKNFKQLYTV